MARCRLLHTSDVPNGPIWDGRAITTAAPRHTRRNICGHTDARPVPVKGRIRCRVPRKWPGNVSPPSSMQRATMLFFPVDYQFLPVHGHSGYRNNFRGHIIPAPFAMLLSGVSCILELLTVVVVGVADLGRFGHCGFDIHRITWCLPSPHTSAAHSRCAHRP